MVTDNKLEFHYRGTPYLIKPWTYGYVVKTLKEQLDINLLTLFEGDALQMFIAKYLSDDEFMLKVWWHFVSEATAPANPLAAYESAIDSLTPEDMATFKDIFWECILRFFDQTRRTWLVEAKRQLLEAMKEALRNENFNSSSENLQPKQVSQETT